MKRQKNVEVVDKSPYATITPSRHFSRQYRVDLLQWDSVFETFRLTRSDTVSTYWWARKVAQRWVKLAKRHGEVEVVR